MHRLLATLLAIAAFLPGQAAMAERLRLVGASTVANEIILPILEPFHHATGHDIELEAVGTGKGMLALARGEARAALTAESLDDALHTVQQIAAADAIGFTAPEGLVMTPLGSNRLIVIINAANPVVTLSRTQLKDLFTGRITNWQQLGGADLPIIPVASVLGNAIRTVIQRRVMEGEPYAATTRETLIPADGIAVVESEPGAIAVVSLSSWSTGVGRSRMVETPEYEHPLGLVTIGPPDKTLRRLISFIRASSRI